MTLTLDLEPETQRRLAELAAKFGETLETYARQVLEREAGGGQSSQLPAQQDLLGLDALEHRLDDLAEGLPPLVPLPADFARADIYGEHP